MSIDCSNLVNLAIGLGMNSVNPSIVTQLRGNCCSATGITCLSTRASKINWSIYSLTGFINWTAVPSEVIEFNVQQNMLTGSVDMSKTKIKTFTCGWGCQLSGNLVLSTSAVFIDLSANSLSGLVAFPQTLQKIYLHNNKMNTTIPAFPNGFLIAGLDFNMLTGSIPLFPPNGQQFSYNNNLFLSGIIPPIPSSVTAVRLECNGFNDQVPNLQNAISISDIGLETAGCYGNQFYGTLRTNNPVFLHAQNLDLVDVFITSTTRLTNCNLSNSTLLNSPNANLLTKCTKTNLRPLQVSSTFTTRSSTALKYTSLLTSMETSMPNTTSKETTTPYTTDIINMSTFEDFYTSESTCVDYSTTWQSMSSSVAPELSITTDSSSIAVSYTTFRTTTVPKINKATIVKLSSLSSTKKSTLMSSKFNSIGYLTNTTIDNNSLMSITSDFAITYQVSFMSIGRVVISFFVLIYILFKLHGRNKSKKKGPSKPIFSTFSNYASR